MAEVHVSKRYNLPAREVLARIGDPAKLADWHPFVERTESLEGGSRRVNTTVDGSRVAETILERGDRHHTWRIDEAPLPYENFVGTIRVRDDGADGCVVECDATFDPKDMDQQEVEEFTRGFFHAGLEAIA